MCVCVCVYNKCFKCEHGVKLVHSFFFFVCFGRQCNLLLPCVCFPFQHDDNIVSLGRAMGIFNDLQSPYLTTIILELHEQDGNFFVKTLFDNHTADSPYAQNVRGMSERTRKRSGLYHGKQI